MTIVILASSLSSVHADILSILVSAGKICLHGTVWIAIELFLLRNVQAVSFIPPVRLILHPFSNFFELISPSGYIAVTLQEFKIIK